MENAKIKEKGPRIPPGDNPPGDNPTRGGPGAASPQEHHRAQNFVVLRKHTDTLDTQTQPTPSGPMWRGVSFFFENQMNN